MYNPGVITKEEKIIMKEITAEIQVLFFQEDDSVIAYSPAFDLSTCGVTREEASERFAEAISLFLTEAAKMGTLDEVMEECGWEKVPDTGGWKPPVYETSHESVNIPVGV